MLDKLIEYIPIYINSVENQIRKDDFPDREKYLIKVKRITEANLKKISSSFFKGINLTFKAKKYQKINNIFLMAAIISVVLAFIFEKAVSKINVPLINICLTNTFYIIAALSFLIAILVSFYFNAIRSTIYRLFSEIDIYVSKPRNNKPNQQ